MLLLVGRVLWGLGLDQVGGKVGERLFGWAGTGGRLRFLTRPLWPLVAIVATVVLFLWPLLLSAQAAAADAAVLSLGVLVLLGIYIRSRAAVARRAGASVRHYTWLPAIGFGAAMTGAGLGFAPVPFAEAPVERRSIRWIGPVVLAIATALLLGLGWWSGVPATRALGASAMVMMSSVLFPTKPFDGAFITNKLVNTLILPACSGSPHCFS